MINASARVVARLLGGAGNCLRRLIGHPARFAAVFVSAALFASASAHAQYSYEHIALFADGQFTVSDGNLNYWTARTGYQTYNLSSGATTTIGLPPGGTYTNGYGDPFGVLDTVNQVFYAATYTDMASYVYAYDLKTSTWLTPGPSGITMANAYGGTTHNGQLYVAGLAEPWNGSYGQDNYIFAFDTLALTSNSTPRHDTLIQTSGNSANLAIATNGDIYYVTYDTGTLYRWTAAQLASVTNDLYLDEADTFLTIADGEALAVLPGGGNGIAVDTAGHIFFAINGSDSLLGMIDPTQALGYRIIYSANLDPNASPYYWYGSISIDGDFLAGAPLYFSTYGDIVEVLYTDAIPEPSSLLLAGAGLATLAFARSLRKGKEVR